MEFELDVNDNKTEILAASADNLTRLFSVKRVQAKEPLDDVASGTPYQWAAADSKSLAGPTATDPHELGFPGPQYYSAVCYLFGRGLREAHPEVPIGLVTSQWGGTKVELWSPPDALAQCGNKGGGGCQPLAKVHAAEVLPAPAGAKTMSGTSAR